MELLKKQIIYSLVGIALNIATASYARAQATNEERQQAETLWEQAIAAKGGRETLMGVKNLAISYDDTARNFLGIAVHRGHFKAVYAFPDKLWVWDDTLPPPFNLTVRVLNISQNFRCTLYAKVAKPTCGSATGDHPSAEEIKEAQYLYFLETNWVKPVPVGVTRDKKVDVVHTRFENKKIDYFLDRKTHLPVRVVVYADGRQRPNLNVELSRYQNIGGVHMPTKQNRTIIDFEINEPFDETIFSVAPSIDKGSHGWRKSKT